ncbi:MAG: methylmalonic aciduria homocystinuria type C protein [Myxococcota bacterium]
MISVVRAGCSAVGLDLTHAFSTATYNALVDEGDLDSSFRLPDFGRDNALALLVANTRAFWPAFTLAMRSDPALAAHPDPVDHYVEQRVTSLAASLPAATETRFSPELPPNRIAFQRLAHVTGFAWLSPAHLCIHPTFGPWISLRAVIVIDAQGPIEPDEPAVRPAVCGCENACSPMLAEAIAATADKPLVLSTIVETWTHWLAVRDACPVGREHRFSDRQIRYHYTRDRAMLPVAPPLG